MLKVENLAFTYDKTLPNALRNISFELHRGELMTILGNNGAGKSTLLKVLTGMEQHQQGAIYLKGERIDRWSIRQRAAKIGYVMQNPNQMITQHLIFDEVAFGLRNQGLNAHTVEERVRAALKICNLDPFRNWPVNAVSYGQRKRVTIAAILALRPEILILDEPSAGQDYRSYLELMRFLTGLTSEGYSIIIITHDLQLALEYADRALVLSAGQIIAADRVVAILTQPAVMQQANLTQPSLAALAPLWGIADAAGLLEAFGAQRRKGETA